MKTYLILAFAIAGLTASASAQTFTAPANKTKVQERPRTVPPVSHREVTGVIPRALRGGNPLQMFNPRAPARYGTAQESVVYDPQYPGKWKGIKLFTLLF